jgi:hypothetical protein
VAAHQAEDAEASLRSCSRCGLAQDCLAYADRGGTDGDRLALQPGWGPPGMPPVRARHVLGHGGVPVSQWAAGMRGNVRRAKLPTESPVKLLGL